MSKKMTFRKKGLAVILCLMMAVGTLTGCGKEPAEPEEEEEEGSLEVPEIKGKEETIGAFTLLVPKGMEGEEDGSESSIILTDEDDSDNYIAICVADKSEAKDYVAALKEEDDNFKDAEYKIDGVKWTGVYYKDTFLVYGKIDKKTVVVTAEGYKYDDDIVVAVMASLEVDEDAEPISLGGATGGGTFAYGDGLYTVEYPKTFRETDPASEFGDLVAVDGSQTIYVTAFDDWDFMYEKMDSIESNGPETETIYIGDTMGTLYTYEDFWGEISAEFVLPLEYRSQNNWGGMTGIYIYTSGADAESAVTEDFRSIINSITINPDYITDEMYTISTTTSSGDYESYWERGWYGWWIYADASEESSNYIGGNWDCLATFDVDDDEVHMVMKDTDGDTDFDVYFSLLDDGSESGWLISDRGTVFGFDAPYFYIDPEETVNILEDYLFFTATVYDGDDWVEVRVVLRPWGADYDDFQDVDSDDLPIIIGDDGRASYGDMYPWTYDDWYVPQMNDEFPGLNAIEGAAD
jgi:hypothetical protein